jgi:hypothetical protein
MSEQAADHLTWLTIIYDDHIGIFY